MDYKDLNLIVEKNDISEPSLTSLANCFRNVTLSYKFYWMMALMKKVVVEGTSDFPAMSLAIEMVGMAWQPICKHQIGLGYKDGFKSIIEQLRQITSISVEARPFDVTCTIQQRLCNTDTGPQILRILKQLLQNVPYCYLQPWTELNREACIDAIKQNSNIFAQKCTPYSLECRGQGSKRELWVHVSPNWATFFGRNMHQLYEFALAGLQDYAMTRNPEIQSIQYMLDWRIQSEVHERQLYFWNQAIAHATNVQSPLHCLFTHDNLLPNCYRIDHYMPLHFAEAEKLWSVFPADIKAPVVNTGNHFQQIGSLLPRLAEAQQTALRHFLASGGSEDFLTADYAGWNVPVNQLVKIPVVDFTVMLSARFSSAATRAVNRFTGFSVAPKVSDSSGIVTNIHINQNNGPVNGGTSIYKEHKL